MPPDTVEASEMVPVVRNEDQPMPSRIRQLRCILSAGLSGIHGAQTSWPSRRNAATRFGPTSSSAYSEAMRSGLSSAWIIIRLVNRPIEQQPRIDDRLVLTVVPDSSPDCLYRHLIVFCNRVQVAALVEQRRDKRGNGDTASLEPGVLSAQLVWALLDVFVDHRADIDLVRRR